MPGFKLSKQALKDVGEVITFLHTEAAPSVADQVEDRLFKSFQELADKKLLGHHRPDIPPNLLCHVVKPYLILFRRTSAKLFIVRVVHGARDVARLF